MTRPIGDRIATQAECLRTAIRLTKQAKDLIPNTLLVTAAEPEMVWVFEDFDNAIKKMTAALGHVDALLDEMEEVE
jgi:hypothetical protein